MRNYMYLSVYLNSNKIYSISCYNLLQCVEFLMFLSPHFTLQKFNAGISHKLIAKPKDVKTISDIKFTLLHSIFEIAFINKH